MMATLLALESLEADKKYVELQLSEPRNDSWGTVALMWQSRLNEILRQIEDLNTNRSSYASVALVFSGNPVIGSSDIRVDFTADALSNFQRLVTARLAERAKQADDETVNSSKRRPSSRVKNTTLFVRDVVRGSMGFILEELPEQAELLPTELKQTVEGTTEFLDQLTSATDAQFQSMILNSTPRVVQATKKLAQTLFQAGASMKIAGDEKRVNLSLVDIDLISKRLNDVTITEDSEVIDGVLQGLLPEKLEFEFKMAGSDGPIIRGDISEELASKYTLDPAFVSRLLLKPGRARTKLIRTVRNGLPTKEQRVMEALEPTIDSDEK